MAVTVRNASEQVVSLSTDGPRGKTVADIVEERIKLGELTKVTPSARSASGGDTQPSGSKK